MTKTGRVSRRDQEYMARGQPGQRVISHLGVDQPERPREPGHQLAGLLHIRTLAGQVKFAR